jgi:hypothetical protein
MLVRCSELVGRRVEKTTDVSARTFRFPIISQNQSASHSLQKVLNMNTPINFKRFQFQASQWKQSSSDHLADFEANSLPQHFAATRFQSSAASLPASFDSSFDCTSSAVSLPECIDSSADSGVGPYDVLCGRDKHSFRNVGNRRFRVTVALYIGRYLEAETKSDKSRVIALVVDIVRANGGRFLKWSSKRQEWVELDEKHTREKVGHALRDTAVAKMGQSVTGSINNRPQLSSSSTSLFSTSATFPSSVQSSSGRNLCDSSVDAYAYRASLPTSDHGRSLHAPHKLPSPVMRSATSRHSLKPSLQLSPEELRDLFSLEAGSDDIDGLCHRASYMSVSSLPGRDSHVRLDSFDNDKLILNLEEVEKLIADEEASPAFRGMWEELPIDSA